MPKGNKTQAERQAVLNTGRRAAARSARRERIMNQRQEKKKKLNYSQSLASLTGANNAVGVNQADYQPVVPTPNSWFSALTNSIQNAFNLGGVAGVGGKRPPLTQQQYSNILGSRAPSTSTLAPAPPTSQWAQYYPQFGGMAPGSITQAPRNAYNPTGTSGMSGTVAQRYGEWLSNAQNPYYFPTPTTPSQTSSGGGGYYGGYGRAGGGYSRAANAGSSYSNWLNDLMARWNF